jgi:hypothetical protein
MTDPSRFPITPPARSQPAGETLRPVERADVGPLPGGVPTPTHHDRLDPSTWCKNLLIRKLGELFDEDSPRLRPEGPEPSPASRSMLANAR